jgi:hypothetical protein
MELSDIATASVAWRPCFRIVPSRFPPIALFERLVDPGDLETAFSLEAMTNDRLREEVGDLSLVPADERVTGAGAGYVMAAFTHPAPQGGRFTDGSYGAYYAAADRATAIAETVHHRTRFLRETRAPPLELEMRVLRATLRATLHDLREAREALPEVFRTDDYAASQLLGRALREAGSEGVAYRSVRRPDGECAAVFRPRAISHCKQAEHLGYVWNGETIGLVYEKRILRS